MTIPFWSNDPTILLNKDHLFEIWPSNGMSLEEKLNAMSRLILFLTVIGYIATMSKRILMLGLLVLFAIFVLFHMRKREKGGPQEKEGFEAPPQQNRVSLDQLLENEFKSGNKKNPFSNVLLTQIDDDPERKAAPPAFNVAVDEDITKNVKRTIQMLNPGIKNTNKQLFGDLWQQFQLDNFLRVFNSTPNTRVVNDQGAYAQYLYNDMKYSSHLDTPEGAMARVQDNWRWIDG